MKKKIFFHIFTAAAVVAFLSLLLSLAVLYPVIEAQVMEELKNEMHIMSTGIEDEGVAFLEVLEDVHRHITLIDEDGRVIYTNFNDHENMGNQSDRPSVIDAMETGEGMATLSTKSITKSRFVYSRLLSNGYVLRITAKSDSVWSVLLRMLFPVILIFIVAVFLSLILSKHAVRKIMEPLEKIDMEHPGENMIYAELTPLLEKIDQQQNQLKHSMIRELEEHDTVHREYTSNISHELKTPLTTIRGFAELLSEGDLSDENVRDYAQTIGKECDRLIMLSNDIIELAKMDENGKTLEFEECDLREISYEVAERYSVIAAGKDISIKVEGSETRVRGNRKILESIISNLCDNAVKFNKKGGSIVIRTQEKEETAELKICDTGIGISEDEQSRIFDRFYRVDKSRSRNAGGSGLGLSIVRNGLKLHNADIEVSSVIGEGTEITLIFGKNI
ncbi:MAG: hypothetical protein K5686_07435 [Lachnospiraceae bacterium]|nr:hypothetical protein [Lachnospiraceae bacterium]